MEPTDDPEEHEVMPRQVVNVTASRDLRFLHIDAGIGEHGLHRSETLKSEVTIVQHYLQPAIDEHIRAEWPELKDAALTIIFHFV